jgi:undecaprenyl-diphosphatase
MGDRSARFVSWLGGPVARTVYVVLGTVWLFLHGRPRRALFLLAAVGGAGGLNTAVKKVVGRHRPASATADGRSFPSGHTTGTIVLTGTGAYLAWHQTGERELALVVALAGVPVAGLVGLSRVVLGEHYPGDVVGGSVLGGLWLAALLKLAPRFRR